MALHGIDISNWQGGMNIKDYFGTYDFFIMKATEGTYFVDKYCDPWVQDCIEGNQLWGFYHFGNNNDPIAEADFFVDNTANYFGHGIPVLDWESDQSVSWVNRFVERVHERTGIWPWIYANPWRFNQGGVNTNCGRWVAAYQSNVPSADIGICAWQYTSTPIDQNYFYGDREAWMKYVTAGGSGGDTGGDEEEVGELTPEQANQLYTVYVEMTRRNDWSGRETNANLYTRACFLGADTKEIKARMDELETRIDNIEMTMDKIYCHLIGECE